MDPQKRQILLQNIKLYDSALAAWEKKDLAEARRLIKEMKAQDDVGTLPAFLLEAYIERDSGRPISELAVLQQIIALFEGQSDPLLSTAWSLLGSTLSSMGENSLAFSAFRKAAETERDSLLKLVEYSNALFTLNHQPDIRAMTMRRYYRGYRLMLREIEPMKRCWYGHERLRVGFLSGDFRTHPVAWFVYALLRYMNREKFEVFCYAVKQENDTITEKLKACADKWRDIETKDWKSIADIIKGDEIDILFDLTGHTETSCLPVLAYQPAPVQLTGIGYMNSSGMANVDGFLSDIYCSPKERDAFFTETMLRLPHSHFCYTKPYAFPDIVQKPPCMRGGRVTFGCFNNFSKITDEMLKAWSEILRRVPRSRLLLKQKIFNSEEGRQYARERIAQAGIDLASVECRGFSTNYLDEYNDMDIALDTSPYAGGLTTCETLYMGVPVVTLIGNRHGSRFGYSMLMNVGIGELAASDMRSYVDIAVALASSPEYLFILHQRLRGMVQQSPLMDGPGYAHDVGNLLQEFYEACRRKRTEGRE